MRAISTRPHLYVATMVSGTNLAAFAVAALVLIVIPGPSVLFVIGRALSLGRGPAIASVVGNGFGVYVVAVLVAFGWAAWYSDPTSPLVPSRQSVRRTSCGSACRPSVIATI
jgi:hypothetical protein